MNSIFTYIDFRIYLRDYYAYKKAANRHFSYRLFAMKSGINSPSFLKEVIDGKRNLTTSAAAKFGKAIGHTDKESVYFRHLVLFNQASNATIKQEHYAVLRGMHGRISEKILRGDFFDYFDKWYTVVIRELVCLHDFNDDFEALAKAVVPSVTPAQARKALELLLSLKLIEKKPDGAYAQTSAALMADEAITSIAIRSFMYSMLDHAKVALNEVPKNSRHISGMTMGISQATYDVIIAEINAFKDRIKRIVSQDAESDRVYHLNMDFFPVSSVVDRNKGADTQ